MGSNIRLILPLRQTPSFTKAFEDWSPGPVAPHTDPSRLLRWKQHFGDLQLQISRPDPDLQLFITTFLQLG